MGKVIVVFILYLFLSALLRLESKLIFAACVDASVIRGIFRVRNVWTRKIPLITLASLHAATISLDSSLKSRKKQVQNEDDNYFSHL
jgi:hypothetical protein